MERCFNPKNDSIMLNRVHVQGHGAIWLARLSLLEYFLKKIHISSVKDSCVLEDLSKVYTAIFLVTGTALYLSKNILVLSTGLDDF